MEADALTTCGGDGGCNICGGMGPLLGYLPCSPHAKPEVREDEKLNNDYDFFRPIIRVALENGSEQKGENEMPTTEWLKQYEAIKDRLSCKIDLDAYFTEKVIGNRMVDVLEMGTVRFPYGDGLCVRPAGGTGGRQALSPDHSRRELPVTDLRGPKREVRRPVMPASR